MISSKNVFQALISPSLCRVFLHLGARLVAKFRSKKFSEFFGQHGFFDQNFFKLCKFTYNFGAFAFKNTFARGRTAWCTKLILFVIPNFPFLDLLFLEIFPPSIKWSKVWFMLFCFAEFLTSEGNFSWHAFISDLFRSIGSFFRHPGKTQRYFLAPEFLRQHVYVFLGEKVWIEFPNMVLLRCVNTSSLF